MTGKKARLRFITPDELFSQMEAYTGHSYSKEIKLDLFEVPLYIRDFGYYGSKRPEDSRPYVARPPRSWKDYVRAVFKL